MSNGATNNGQLEEIIKEIGDYFFHMIVLFYVQST